MQHDDRYHLRNIVILLAGLFLFWELAYLVIGEVAMRSPWQTIRFLGKLMQTDIFWTHLSESLRAFAAALAIAIGLGLLIGFSLGLHRLSGDAMEPMLVALYSIPKITLYPIILLAFGIGISAKIAFGAIHGIIPVALFTLNAVRSTKPILIKTGRVRIATDALVHDSGVPDPTVHGAQQFEVLALPEEALTFLLGSRYCETDRLSDTAWRLFSNAPTG